MTVIRSVLLVAVLTYAGLCAYLFAVQRRLIYYPMPADIAGPQLTLEREDASVRVSMRERASEVAVLYFGGNAEDVSQTVPELAATFPDAAIYAMHYRSYGASTGTPSETALVGDALALFDRVRTQQPRIVVVGRSLGSGVAVQLAAARPVERLVLITPYGNLTGIAAAHYPYVPVRWLMRDHFDSIRHAPALRLPTTVIVAADDRVIPRWSTDELLAAFAPGTVRLHVFPATGHDSVSSAPGYAGALRGE